MANRRRYPRRLTGFRRRETSPLRLRLEPLEPRLLLDAGPTISELLAVNHGTLADEDGDFSDYIELFNSASAPVNLDGWHLTDREDDFDKWRLPSVTLDPGGFLVVFASEKDRRDPAGELHTNFKLDAGGEYLALVRPDGTIAQEFGDEFPSQVEDISYGLEQELTVTTLVGPESPARILIPANDSL